MDAEWRSENFVRGPPGQAVLFRGLLLPMLVGPHKTNYRFQGENWECTGLVQFPYIGGDVGSECKYLRPRMLDAAGE